MILSRSHWFCAPQVLFCLLLGTASCDKAGSVPEVADVSDAMQTDKPDLSRREISPDSDLRGDGLCELSTIEQPLSLLPADLCNGFAFTPNKPCWVTINSQWPASSVTEITFENLGSEPLHIPTIEFLYKPDEELVEYSPAFAAAMKVGSEEFPGSKWNNVLLQPACSSASEEEPRAVLVTYAPQDDGLPRFALMSIQVEGVEVVESTVHFVGCTWEPLASLHPEAVELTLQPQETKGKHVQLTNVGCGPLLWIGLAGAVTSGIAEFGIEVQGVMHWLPGDVDEGLTFEKPVQLLPGEKLEVPLLAKMSSDQTAVAEFWLFTNDPRYAGGHKVKVTANIQ